MMHCLRASVLEDGYTEGEASLGATLGWLLPVPFYFMELLVGFVQALVFMLLDGCVHYAHLQHDEAEPAGQH